MTREELEKKKGELSEEIEKYEGEISEIKEKVKELLRQKENIQNEIDVYVRKDIGRQFAKKGAEANSSNSISFLLTPKTQTIPIFDNFYYHRDAQFLILKSAFRFPKEMYQSIILSGWRVSLVIACTYDNIWFESTGLTMTHLKRYAGSYVTAHSDKVVSKNDPVYSLICEMCKVIAAGDLHEGYIPFEIPCYLGAQSSANRTGYGYGYDGRGTYYGETGEYFIIGVQIS